jgi:hypothetical protein
MNEICLSYALGTIGARNNLGNHIYVQVINCHHVNIQPSITYCEFVEVVELVAWRMKVTLHEDANNQCQSLILLSLARLINVAEASCPLLVCLLCIPLRFKF